MKKLDQPIIFALLLFSVLGLMSAIYLTNLHFQNESNVSICDINSKISCTNLAQSKHSLFLGIPIAILGIIGYIVFLGLVLAIFLNPTSLRIKKALFYIATLALLFTFYLIQTEIRVGIFCLVCLVSQISTISIFCLSYCLKKNSK